MKNNIAYFAILSGIFLYACGGKKTASVETKTEADPNVVTLTPAQFKTAGIQTGHGETRTISSTLNINGTIDVPPQNMVSISAPLGGYLKKTDLLPGMQVSQGQVIAIMEDPQYIQIQQDYLTTAAKLNLLEMEYNRQKELNKTKAGSDKLLQQAETDFRSQKIALRALSEKLKLLSIQPETLNETNLSRSIPIYSPITGFVSKVNVNIGKYVNPADVLFELINPADIHLKLRVYEKDLDKIFVGQKLFAWTNAHPDVKYPCEIILIGRDVDADRAVEVHCHFEHYDKILVPGMYMNAKAEIKAIPSLTVPDDAILNFEGKNYIFVVVKDNTFEMREVTLGPNENGFTAIEGKEGISASDNIVIKGAQYLLMSLKNSGEE